MGPLVRRKLGCVLKLLKIPKKRSFMHNGVLIPAGYRVLSMEEKFQDGDLYYTDHAMLKPSHWHGPSYCPLRDYGLSTLVGMRKV